jgi:hypothetical protein
VECQLLCQEQFCISGYKSRKTGSAGWTGHTTHNLCGHNLSTFVAAKTGTLYTLVSWEDQCIYIFALSVSGLWMCWRLLALVCTSVDVFLSAVDQFSCHICIAFSHTVFWLREPTFCLQTLPSVSIIRFFSCDKILNKKHIIQYRLWPLFTPSGSSCAVRSQAYAPPPRHYNPVWVLVFCTNSYQRFLSLMRYVHFFTFNFFKSF